MFNVDIGSAVVRFFAEWRRSKRALAWGRLVFSMAFSGIASFYGVAGAARIAGEPEIIADGMGMLAVAVSLVALFTKSEMTRGMTISVPSKVVKKMHQGGRATIRRK